MKKILLFLFALAMTNIITAQTVIKKMFNIDAVGSQRAGILTLPKDYATNPDSCVLLIFFHGSGESGDGTLGTVDKLYANGSPVSLAANGNTMTFTSPVDGKVYRFIILALQGIRGWCPFAEEGVYVIKNDILKNYKIFKNAIFITGLSAGAQTTWETITRDSTCGLYAAGIPMSTTNASLTSLQNVATYKIKVWAFHGSSDGGLTDVVNSVRYVNSVESLQPGLTHLTLYPGAHCCWGTYYDPAYNEVIPCIINGIFVSKKMNLYEFMLASMKGNNFLFNPTSSSTGTVVPATTTVPKINITVSGTSAILDGSASTGAGGISSWSWEYVAPAGASAPWWDNGRSDGGGQPVPKTISNLTKGTWIFKLNIYDKYGGSASLSSTSIVGTTPVVILPVANAGSNKSITDSVSSLDASSSTGTGITYKWTQVSGANTAIIATPTNSITTIQGLITSDYIFQVLVTDNAGKTSTSQVRITVTIPVKKIISTVSCDFINKKVIITYSDGTIQVLQQ